MRNHNFNFHWIFIVFTCLVVMTACQAETVVSPTVTVVKTELVESEPTSTVTQTTTPVPSDTPTPTELPTKTPVEVPEGVELVMMKSPEGIDLVGYLREPEIPLDEGLVVVLAHGHTSSHKEWKSFEDLLIENGIATMSFDFRGHGASSGSDVFSNIGVDVVTVIDAVREKGYERIICIGSSMGGTACLAGAVEAQIDGLVMLSSEWKIGSRLVSKADIQALAIPKIHISTEQDIWTGPEWSVEGYQETAELLGEPKEIYVYPGTSHATQMFFDDYGNEVLTILLNFVKSIAK